MSTLTTIAASDIISASRAVINANFAALNADKVDIASTYANPPWISSLDGSKIVGNISGGAATATLAAAATVLATPRTIAGVAFDGSANIAIASTGLSDSAGLVRGASALSTAGAIPFVASAGSLTQAASTLFWDSANARLGVGTNAPASALHLSTSGATDLRVETTSATNTTVTFRRNGTTLGFVGAIGGAQLGLFDGSGTAGLVMAPSTRNILLGTTSDDATNRLQVAGNIRINVAEAAFPLPLRMVNSSATAGDWRFQIPGTAAGARDGRLEFGNANGWPHLAISQDGTTTIHNQVPTLGVTQFLVRAGAGQGGTNLQTWQNAAGTALVAIESSGRLQLSSASNPQVFFNNGATAAVLGAITSALGSYGRGLAVGFNDQSDGAFQASAFVFRGATASTTDLALARNAAGILEVNNGTAGTFRDLRVRDLFQNGTANTAVFGGQTVATGQVLFGTAAGVAGTNANLFWDNANGRLGIGTNAPNSRLDVFGSGLVRSTTRSSNDQAIVELVAGPSSFGQLYNTIGNLMITNASASGHLIFRTVETERARFAATTGNLLLNTTTDDGTNRLQVAGSVALVGVNGTPGLGLSLTPATNQALNLITQGALGFIQFNLNGANIARFAATTGNLLLNTTTDDGTNRLQVNGGLSVLGGAGSSPAGVNGLFSRFVGNVGTIEAVQSGTSGRKLIISGNPLTFSNSQTGLEMASITQAGVYSFINPTATIGATTFLVGWDGTNTSATTTQLVVRAGSGQGATNLFTVQNAAGTQIAAVNASGVGFLAGLQLAGGGDGSWQSTGVRFRSDSLLGFASGTNASGTLDASLSRAGANQIQVGDGAANALGTLLAAALNISGTTVSARYRATLATPASASAAGTTGDILWDANFIYVCTATNTWKRAAIATW